MQGLGNGETEAAASLRVLEEYTAQVRERYRELTERRLECEATYGPQLVSAVTISSSVSARLWADSAMKVWDSCLSTLRHFVRSLEARAAQGTILSEQFGACVTKVRAPSSELLYRGCFVDREQAIQTLTHARTAVRPVAHLFTSASIRSMVSLPDNRLIQWDCGKLQELEILLRKISSRGDRALVFTQMTRMLDILESFLNLHDFRYLRLDGATKTEDRQRLMERFNSDQRIFCMILTTRAGGVGLNLTGANCVVFYDNDWNPAIDAQAQDRVHRIGQTKPVHIYRMVCEKTVEENILRKANEKRTLESLVISQAEFTTDTIKKRFDVMELVAPERVRDRPSSAAEEKAGGVSVTRAANTEDTNGFDLLLMAAEDRQLQARAADMAAEERQMALEDFQGTSPVDDTGYKPDVKCADEMKESEEIEMQRNEILQSLTPIQKFALRVIETYDPGPIQDSRITPNETIEKQFALERLLERQAEHSLSDDEELFYAVDEGKESYLKVLTDTDNEMKIYLPLRDGGPDELVMSTVVGGTAAAGLQSAEDAAFFPYAYGRMGRTEKATKRQKEKNALRKKEEQEKKRKLEEAEKAAKTPVQAEPGPEQKKTRMVSLAGGTVASSDSRSTATLGQVSKLPGFPLSLRVEAGPGQVAPEKPKWTIEEDKLLQLLCVKFASRSRGETGQEQSTPNFSLVALWIGQTMQFKAGRRSFKSPNECEERFAVIKSRRSEVESHEGRVTDAKVSSGAAFRPRPLPDPVAGRIRKSISMRFLR